MVNVPRFFRLILDGRQVDAIVREVTPREHETFVYEYTIGGKKFIGFGFLSDGMVQRGQRLSVLYSSSEPGLSVAGDPKEKLVNELLAIVLSLMIFPVTIVFLFELNFKLMKLFHNKYHPFENKSSSDKNTL